jgi:anti-sigma factor RsiW
MKLWRRRREMKCQDLVELVTDYFEDALSARDRARFERHIGECRHCNRYVDQMRVTIRVLGRLPTETIPPAARDALLEAFRDWKRERV